MLMIVEQKEKEKRGDDASTGPWKGCLAKIGVTVFEICRLWSEHVSFGLSLQGPVQKKKKVRSRIKS